MIQRGEDFGFALKTREPFRIRRDCGRQNLERDLSLQLGVRRAEHLPHAAFADLSGDLVDAETSAGSEGQTPGIITFRVARTRSLLGDALVFSDF